MMKFLISILFASHSIAAPLKVVTSTTDLAWLAREIGGNHVEVTSLLRGNENPHYIDASPEFIRRVAEAQVVCIVGLDLEVGWMPKILSRSGNASVQPGGKGYCETGKAVHVIEKPTGQVDRSMGDVHPAGNPHFWLSTKHFLEAANEMTQVLSAVDVSHMADYRSALKKLNHKLVEVQQKGEKRLKPLLANVNNPILIEYHKEFSYFVSSYGMKSFGSIEEKPGVAPSAGRLAEVAQQAKLAGVRFILAADTAPKKTVERFAELSGLPIVMAPVSLQPRTGLLNYVQHQEQLVESIVKVLGPKG